MSYREGFVKEGVYESPKQARRGFIRRGIENVNCKKFFRGEKNSGIFHCKSRESKLPTIRTLKIVFKQF